MTDLLGTDAADQIATADRAAREKADEIAREEADEIAKDAAAEAYREAYKKAFRPAYEAYREAYGRAYLEEIGCLRREAVVQLGSGADAAVDNRGGCAAGYFDGSLVVMSGAVFESGLVVR